MLNKYLVLERPLGTLDLETTSLDTKIARIVQIALTIHYPHRDCIKWKTLVHPEMKIPNDQHGISDEAVVDAPKFRDIAPALAPKITNIDLNGYNVNYDIAVMKSEMKRVGVEWNWSGCIIDPLQIYRMKRGHTLSNAYLEYGGENGEPLPPGSKLEGAHDAGNDVDATDIVLRGMLLRYSNLPRTPKELSAFCFPHPENAVDTQGKFIWVGEDAAFNFGKWRGKLLKDPTCRGYLNWIINNDFPDEIKDICSLALDGDFPKK